MVHAESDGIFTRACNNLTDYMRIVDDVIMRNHEIEVILVY